MKLKLYPVTGAILLFLFSGLSNPIAAQDCGGLIASCTATESRCTATGSIQVKASGGSGTYNYRISGTVSSDFTSSSLISGLPPGTYVITVKDIVSGCTYQTDSIALTGTYRDPRFGVAATDVTCVNGNDGSISVTDLQNGRGPFSFTLVAPSPMGVGSSNANGIFTGLIPGSYSVQMTDSCGGIQTRNISIQNYGWSILSAPVARVACTSYQATVNLQDNKGNTNASGTAFNGFRYGVSVNPGDTSWFAEPVFDFDPGQQRTVALLVKDRCGRLLFKNWTNTAIPSVAANVAITALTCTGFDAAITGQQNLSSPVFCLLDQSGNTVSCNSNGSFSHIPYGSYCIRISNSCYDTVITRCFTQAQALPAITGAVNIGNYTCSTVTATVTGQQNLVNPQYCLFDQLGNASGACNASGVFSKIPYGAYTIKATDGCTGKVFILNFNASKRVRSVAASAAYSNYTCNSFDASLGSPLNLVNPRYCLMDDRGNLITCNSTGIFPGLSYGSYCIRVQDDCADTTIQRCFTVSKPPAPTGGAAVISNKTCAGFDVRVNGQTNIFNGQYCLLDSEGNTVTCNATGAFSNLPYGSYCIQITDGCSGTVIRDCFTAAPPVPSVGPVQISNLSCAGFIATVSAQRDLTNPSFCLYDGQGNPAGACNHTGIFNVSGFGSFSIRTTDGCAGKSFTSVFSVNKPVASIAPTVNFSNQSCNTFTASANGQQNLSGATYLLKNSSGTVIATNSTGVFNNLAYGSYCMEVQSSCLDTVIERCFTLAAAPTLMSVFSTPDCLFNTSDLHVQVSSGFPPYTVNVYDTLGNLLKTASSSDANLVLVRIPAQVPGQRYRVVVNGACGAPAVQYLQAQESQLEHGYSVTPKCPSSIMPSGSSDLLVTASSNLGTVDLTITQKNFAPVSIGYSARSGNSFTFSNLDNAVYVITYTFSHCTITINDTVTLPVYTFPNLARSAAYSCDNNSFSIGASVSGGIAPFTYQVIGSSPSTPSIISAPQSDPVFSISNGVQYPLVRLRAVDACGNAALNDVSILPLANTIVSATANCVYKPATLSTDVLPNASYTWYKKTDEAATDSVLVGSGPAYTIPYLTPADTGIYISRMSVNGGCLTKLAYFHLDGLCGGLWLLPQPVVLKGRSLSGQSNELSWEAAERVEGMRFGIERRSENKADFATIGSIPGNTAGGTYRFLDDRVSPGIHFYRLRITGPDNRFSYSNTVQINTQAASRVSLYPNPAGRFLHIHIEAAADQPYRVQLYTISGQSVFSASILPGRQDLVYQRDASVAAGLYLLKLENPAGGSVVYKVVFGEY
jgi:hypothetical protein